MRESGANNRRIGRIVALSAVSGDCGAPIQRGDHNSTSLSEDAVRQGSGGAIAVIGCVTGSQPCAHTLLDGFVAAMARTPDAAIGAWWQDAIRHYVREERLATLTPTESWYPASIYFQGMKFVLLGDPTVRLRGTARP